MVLTCSGGGSCGGFGRGTVSYFLGRAARMVLPKVLVKNGLERKALPTDVTVEGLVPSVLPDVVFQLVFAGVFLPTDAADEGCDPHVKPHVSIQAALLVEGFAAVDAGEPGVVTEPAVAYLFSQVLLISSHVQSCRLLPLASRREEKGLNHVSSLSLLGLVYPSLLGLANGR